MPVIPVLFWFLRLSIDIAPLLAVLVIYTAMVKLKAYVIPRLREKRELALERYRAEHLIRELKREAIGGLLAGEHSHRTTKPADTADVHATKVMDLARAEAVGTLVADASSQGKA